jgi:hypothetical protein
LRLKLRRSHGPTSTGRGKPVPRSTRHRGWRARGTHHEQHVPFQLIIAGFIALTLQACSRPEVTYSVVGGTTAIPTSDFDEAGYQFRIARSLISIKSADAGSTVLKDTVIDPLPTIGWVVLPENNGLWYSLSLSDPEGGAIPSDQFNSLIKTGTHKSFPIAACRTGLLSIGGVNASAGMIAAVKKSKVQIVPTELAIPASVGTPARSYSTLYRMAGVNNWMSTTALEVTYLPDTSLVKSIGSTVTDNVQTTLKSITALASSAAALAAFAAPAPQSVRPVPPAPLEIATFPVTIADNTFIRPIPIPYKGTITPHTVCGADVTETGRPSPAQAIDDLTAAMTAAQGVYKAWA